MNSKTVAQIIGNPQLGYEAGYVVYGTTESEMFSTAQDAFDWMSEKLPGVTIDVSVFGSLDEDLANP